MKRLIIFIILIPILICTVIGIYYAVVFCINNKYSEKKILEKVFSNVQNKKAMITEFFVYGKCLNISGKIEGISKDNVETVRLCLTDGMDFEELYKMDYNYSDGYLYFTTTNEMNNSVDIDKLKVGNYYLMLRLKLNNSVNYRYYSFDNSTKYNNIEYYTITKEAKNNKVIIENKNINYEDRYIPYIAINVQESALPENIYDFVIDAGHGGADKGNRNGDFIEADITLDYAKKLKEKLEALGYKVKLTRDGSNEDRITLTSMYNEDGRINVAQDSKSKLLISLHVNDSYYDNNSGIEVYAPVRCNLDFAKSVADGVVKKVDGIDYSDSHTYKELDGVYEDNFTKQGIEDFKASLEAQGIEPYNVNTNTPSLYIIREVGGIATNAYVDGRNPAYGKNKYWDSNIGLEAYKIELGYIETDSEALENNIETYAEALAEAISKY